MPLISFDTPWKHQKARDQWHERGKQFIVIIMNIINKILESLVIEEIAQTCSVKKVFLEIRKNSQENTCARVSISIKLQAWGLQLY